jgi:hypothetical protein
MKDIMQHFFEQARKISEALNKAGIVPPENVCMGVLLVMHELTEIKHTMEMPIGGSLNWNKDEKKWEVTPQLGSSIVDEEFDPNQRYLSNHDKN